MSAELSQKVEQTLNAYLSGAFPMAENGELNFFECAHRSILLYDVFHVSQRLKRRWRQRPFELKIDQAFSQVVRRCRQEHLDSSGEKSAWITHELIEIYETLHAMGIAHSFEAWDGEELVGGVYGMAFGGAFLAESMFHCRSHASNLCVVYMMECLHQSGFDFCDIQYANDHTIKFHPVEWTRETFLKNFKRALGRHVPLEEPCLNF